MNRMSLMTNYRKSKVLSNSARCRSGSIRFRFRIGSNRSHCYLPMTRSNRWMTNRNSMHRTNQTSNRMILTSQRMKPSCRWMTGSMSLRIR
jgi:hypothetical protein